MNKKHNRIIKMTPIEAAKIENAGIVFQRRFGDYIKEKSKNYEGKFAIGTKVRVIAFKNASEQSNPFKKDTRYSTSVFTIYKKVSESFPVQYLLEDEQANLISRPFLERHLIKIDNDEK